MLNLAHQRMVTIRAPMRGGGGYAFAREGREVPASIQPLRGDLAQREYGAQPAELRLMLCGLCGEPAVGDGVCVDVPGGASPDFRVVYAARWPGHWEAHLRLIPPAERGDGAWA